MQIRIRIYLLNVIMPGSAMSQNEGHFKTPFWCPKRTMNNESGQFTINP